MISINAPPTTQRVPASTQRLVTAVMIDDAIEKFRAGVSHSFDASRSYDLLLPSGERMPPKAIFGIALSQIIGRAATPEDFSAGWGEPCFGIIEDAGYPIVAKDVAIVANSTEADEERVWAEGSPKAVSHLRRERAPGLAIAKKRKFVELHGKLFCERCKVVPSQALGAHGDACIEVHHHAISISEMHENSITRLGDLKCLCANCHRIVHRELKANLDISIISL